MKAAVATLLAIVGTTTLAAPPEVETGTLVPGKGTSSPVVSTGHYERGPEVTEVMPSDAAITAARAMAKCAVEKRPAEVQAALDAADWRSFILATQELSSTMSRCAGKLAGDGVSQVQFGFGPPTYYGVLSEAWLLQKGMRRLEPTTYAAASPSFAWLSRGARDIVVLRLADCLAHKEPLRVEALVRSAPLSAKEKAGFASINPVLPACLESNVTLSATKTKLRLALATAMYRRSADIPSVQQSEAPR